MNNIMAHRPYRPANRWYNGQPLSARHLNEMVDAANQPISIATPPATNYPRDPTVFIEWMQVDYVSLDWLWAGLYNEKSGVWSRKMRVALPWNLRRTPFHNETHNGITYQYTSYTRRRATSGGDEEYQVITPPYVEQDWILCIYGIQGGEVVKHEGTAIYVHDLNQAGRAWAEEAT